jgi:MFS family permease
VSGAETAPPARMTWADWKVILASSAGTVFEWYDFYLYGALAVIIGANFFSESPAGVRDVYSLLAFAAGFLVRPFGALIFGRLGDLVGRKYTFFVTILIMGLSTVAVSILPGSASIGYAAPVMLIALRLCQGLALGGEYGGAATYVAEFAPAHRRGYWTGFIQTTATAGLFLSLIVILGVRSYTGEEAFIAWGWRVPFALSAILLIVSIWIRLQLAESPAFLRMKAAGTRSKSPLREAFGTWRNARWGLVALFGLTMGQGVVWYAGQFYPLIYMQTVLKVDGYTANLLTAWALLLGSIGFIGFGALSDRVGRKPIILGGCFLAAITYFPLFATLGAHANPALHQAQRMVPVVLSVDEAACSWQFNPVGTAKYDAPCDVAKGALARAGVKYSVKPAAPGSVPTVTLGGLALPAVGVDFPARLGAALVQAGYPADTSGVVRMRHPLDIGDSRTGAIILVLTILVIYVTMVYGPIAAALVELFPTRIRYTGMSLPYHIGNGWFGGLLPASAIAIAAWTGDPMAGLWYPIAFAGATCVIGLLFLPETRGRDLEADDRGGPAA